MNDRFLFTYRTIKGTMCGTGNGSHLGIVKETHTAPILTGALLHKRPQNNLKGVKNT